MLGYTTTTDGTYSTYLISSSSSPSTTGEPDIYWTIGAKGGTNCTNSCYNLSKVALDEIKFREIDVSVATLKSEFGRFFVN